MSDRIGLFTGSFDPMTNGHWISLNAPAELFDKLYVGVFYNLTNKVFSLLKPQTGSRKSGSAFR